MLREDAVALASRTLAVLLTVWALTEVPICRQQYMDFSTTPT